MRPTELAAHLRLSKQATNDLIRDLENLGYLRSERDPTDGRARILRYTDRGWRLFRTGSRISHDVGERWARAVGQQSYDQFHATLRAIVDATHHVAGDSGGGHGRRQSPPGSAR